MEIQTTLNHNTLFAINKLWSLMSFPGNVQGKIDKSIVEATAAKFMKKQLSRMGKSTDKDIKITLQYFEAATISNYLRGVNNQWLPSTSLEHIQISNYYNQIHQKIQ